MPEGDADSDGVLNYLDVCPNEDETINGFKDDDGCPDEWPAQIVIENGKIQILETIRFRPNSSRGSYPIVDQIALALRKHHELEHIEIGGYTDSTGPRELNLRLSRARARSVRQYLLARGIRPDRLTATGYGPDHPIGDNNTDEGRAKNRRVEFVMKLRTINPYIAFCWPSPNAAQLLAYRPRLRSLPHLPLTKRESVPSMLEPSLSSRVRLAAVPRPGTVVMKTCKSPFIRSPSSLLPSCPVPLPLGLLLMALSCSCTLPEVRVPSDAGGPAAQSDKMPVMTGSRTGASDTAAKPADKSLGAADAAMEDAAPPPQAKMMTSGKTRQRDAAVSDAANSAQEMPQKPGAGANSMQRDAATETETAGRPAMPTAPPTDASKPSIPSSSACLVNVGAYSDAGQFQVEAMKIGEIHFWVPMVPSGCKVPIIHLANGGTLGSGEPATCSSYEPQLERYASHGFLACCYESPNTGSGKQALEAFHVALQMFPNLADKRFGSTGQGQGGQAAFVAVSLAQKEFESMGGHFAGFAIQPASGFGSQPEGGWQQQYAAIRSPMFMFSSPGSSGLGNQKWVQDGFDALDDSTEAYHWSKEALALLPVPNAEAMQIGPAWFRWKLLDDMDACRYLKATPTNDGTWKEVAAQHAMTCE